MDLAWTHGGLVLYLAFTAHFVLALWALYQRRSFNMGWGEGVRLALGFSIVPLLIHHYLSVRWVYSTYGISRRYDVVLLNYFMMNPFHGERQILVLLIAWVHGCFGIHYWLRHRPTYRKLTHFLLVAAAKAILGELGYRDHYVLTAIGDTVHVAARLQELTKKYACQAVISDNVGEMAGVALSSWPGHEVQLRGREALQTVRIIENAAQMFV